MPTLHVTTFIAAPAERVFELSRSVDLHKLSMLETQERPVEGTTSGLLNLHDFVLWEARHLRKMRRLKVRITAMEMYRSFTDEMVEGDFRQMRHEHHFKSCENGTIMIDLFTFETPYGILGRLFNYCYLTAYMRSLLEKRNAFLRAYAESDKWKSVLQTKSSLPPKE